jgi:uncharacterized repeat protein (TIGR03803 family)
MKAITTALIACALLCLVHSRAAEAQAETVLYSFCSQAGCTDGDTPEAGLIEINGILYGTASAGGTGGCGGGGCGTVFSLNLTNNAETVVYSFCSQTNCTDGWNPIGAVLNVNGMLYGTTVLGGASMNAKDCGVGCGTVFSLNLTNDAETVLYSFCSEKKCKDGESPVTGVINTGGVLYGTTSEGGKGCSNNPGCGIAYSFDLTTSAENVLHSFTCKGEFCAGGVDAGSLIDINGTLNGTTYFGGKHDYGTVFSLNPTTGAETVLYSFCRRTNCTDGSAPDGLIDVNGTLYGTTRGGSAYDRSTVFSLNLTNNVETVLYSFCSQTNCTDGAVPGGVVDVNGTLYGTTYEG